MKMSLHTNRGFAAAALLGIAFSGISSVYADSSVNTTQTLIKVLRAQLPEGWKLSFDQKDSWIEIQRIKPELMFTIAPNLSGEEKPTSQRYTMGLSIVPFVSRDEYKKFQTENEKIRKKMDSRYNALTHSRPLFRWPDSFVPANEEEKREFEEYKLLDSSLHSLPDFYFEDLSLSCSSDDQDPVDDKVRTECKQVRWKIAQTLSTY